MSEGLEQRKRIVNSRLRKRVKRTEMAKPVHPLPIQEEVTVASPTFYYAGFWMRLWAFLLDLITVFSINLLLVSPFIRLTNIDGLLSLGPYSFETFLGAVVFFFYFAIMTKLYGQTIGKMVMGLKVISTNDEHLKWSQIVFREGVGRLLHQVFFLFYVIYVMVAFTEKKQGLHDIIADTFVIYDRSE
ncbi:RDD family protein [Halalkalibacter alkalisediminis]|uniref:RDD family protein n=1 Tax=Halalkalibacter alkalisediminis TaxID=935616 RepID=A0ABV6NBV2_9BACI|nr:RDD family protein [Halalkalibacter alkalisediminis]